MQISVLFCFLCSSAVMKPARNSQEEKGFENSGLRKGQQGSTFPGHQHPAHLPLKSLEMFPTSCLVISIPP